MSASVRISRKTAQYLLCWRPDSDDSAFRELEAALAKASRASATRRTLRKPKQAKQKAKREARADVRAQVVSRAAGQCEACSYALMDQPWNRPEMDHFFGKARSESLDTCWLLCGHCHRSKTANDPSSAGWLRCFAAHCAKHGYIEAGARARKNLAWVEAKGAP